MFRTSYESNFLQKGVDEGAFCKVYRVDGTSISYSIDILGNKEYNKRDIELRLKKCEKKLLLLSARDLPG